MSESMMSSAERLGAAMTHREADRVPFVLPAVLQGARELGMTIAEYFSDPEDVAEGQWRLYQRYRHDALIGFMYGAVEVEAWGGEAVFIDNGPPNAGEPPLTPEAIPHLDRPRVGDHPCLLKVLELIRLLAERSRGGVPVMGGVISPFSLPVMQLGFGRYIELIYEAPERFEHLMKLNEEFCVEWANAQIEAGAAAISYADPVCSPTIIPCDLARTTGFPVARRTIARINGAVATSFASGHCLPVIDDVAGCGAVGVVASAHEDLSAVKEACKGRLTVMGNLNAIAMRRWTVEDAEAEVKRAIAAAARGGGFVLSDNHGEIPWQVPDDVLMAVSDAVHRWGRYPIDWEAPDETQA